MGMYLGGQKISPIIKSGATINNQDKTITKNGTYTADAGYTGLGEVTVNVSGGGSTTGFLVQVIDYDGTVLKSERLDTGDTFTLPSQPSHTGLTFQSWSSPITITSNTVTVTNSDITIGATYTTTSGLSEFDITLTEVTGLSVTLNMDGTKNWGDGTSDTSTTHTYASVGDYTITCNGSTMTTSSSSGLFGQTYSVKNYYVKDVRLGSSVTSISTYAFNNCNSLTSITIPSSVTSIGTYAFYNCYSLASITIPEGVTSIGTYAFSNCNSLTSIALPSSVTSIGDNAFNNCYSLTSITIPEGVTSIGTYAFQYCHSLTSITIPEGVTSISTYAFYNCYSLTSITIPSSVTSIGSYAFSNCRSFTSIALPSSVTSIGTYAFQYCYSLTSITIPSSVTSIGDNAFSNCSSLASITIPEGVTSIGGYAFSSCYSLTSITIPSSVTSIGDNAFNSCYSLTSIIIPEGVTSIGGYVFSSCSSLASITIPSSVTRIYSSAFSSCYSLTSISVPSRVTNIGDSAFSSCYSILEYDFSNHTVVPTLSSTNAFSNINQICKIYVPWDLYLNWKAATNWSTYADYISNKNPATLNFTVTPSNSIIYVEGSQIQGTSTSWIGIAAPYVIYDSTNNVVLSSTQTGITEGSSVNITADLTTSNKITLSIGVTGLLTKFTIDGVTFDATDEGNGNYSISVVGSGTVVDYFINGGSSYMDAEGTITTTGSNITEAITLTPAIESTFVRPDLTADGTLGGNSFAVKDIGAGTSTSTYAWRAVDNSNTTFWNGNTPAGNKTYVFYNPDVLKVSELTYTYSSTSYIATAVSIEGSNDNSTWEDITSTYSGSSTTYTSTLTNSKYYKYYRLTFTPYSTYVRIYNLAITGTYKTPAS